MCITFKQMLLPEFLMLFQNSSSEERPKTFVSEDLTTKPDIYHRWCQIAAYFFSDPQENKARNAMCDMPAVLSLCHCWRK